MGLRVVCVLLGSLVATAFAREIDYARDVHPLLLARCGSCHSGSQPQAALRLITRADILRGGRSGPAIVANSSASSLLIQRITGVKTPRMPYNADPLPDAEVRILKDWIDQGAKPGSAPEAPSWTPSLTLRKPPASDLDALLTAYFRDHSIAPPPGIADAVFARRAWLDLWGVVPSPEELDRFLADTHPEKRARLVERLLSDGKNYAENWISWWNDLLRNDEGVDYEGARKSITPWLRRALEENTPYDRMVTALLNPAQPSDPDGYLVGVNWRGTVSASQTPPMQAAQNSAQVFLGLNLKCNSCHDSFISRWKLADAYGLASYFALQPLPVYRCDVPTGKVSSPRFLYPELDGAAPGTSVVERRAAAARLFTTRENGRFPRTFVNRIWQKLMGRGLVEPADDMDVEPWDPAILDWLAADFAEHHYDIRNLLRRVMLSRAYSLPAVRLRSSDEKTFLFRGPLYRRLSAEQFADSVSAITGEWRILVPRKAGAGSYARDWALKSDPLTRALGRPIRDQVFTERDQTPTTLQALELLNGQTLSTLLARGSKRMLRELPPAPPNVFDSGVINKVRVPLDVEITGVKKLWLLMQDEASYNASMVQAGWEGAELIGSDGSHSLPELSRIPLPTERVLDIAGKGYTHFRATAAVDPACIRDDIGPRVRFFVFTERPDRDQLVPVTGGPPVAATQATYTIDSLIARVYEYALARNPSSGERSVAREFLATSGRPNHISSEGLADLLWSVCMSPEFQYIR